ncbi:MAG: acyl carrier protein [Actinobacteria bacterium]|nr:acyl carrier protein [Actinomycetota bacterium]
MERSEVLDAVRESAVELLKVEPDQVTEQAAFGEDLDADSLDLTELVMALEDRFGIEVPEDDLGDVRTVGDAVDLVMAKLGSGASA